MTILQKLQAIQQNLNAPKNLRNSFGNYNYRSAEGILEALKPLLEENKCILLLKDELVNIGQRYYVKATAIIQDVEKGDFINTEAFAREEETKKGMDGSQITGASSSYARKYALNGLFLIDDTKDSDSTNAHDNVPEQAEKVFNTPDIQTPSAVCDKCGTVKIQGAKGLYCKPCYVKYMEAKKK